MDETMEQGETPCSSKQRDVAYAMTYGDKTVEDVLAAYGVTEEEFVDWVCGGEFPVEAASMARGVAETRAAYVWAKLMELVRDGNVSAIRLYLDFLYKRPVGHGSEKVGGGTELGGLRESIFGGDTE